MRTQSQEYMEMAAARVSDVEGKTWAKVYGGLCHSFPVLVRTAGLAQAVAYHQSKAAAAGDVNASGPKQAHRRVIEDYEALLPKSKFDIATAPLSEYMQATRRVLAAGVFYKRFAASILEATAGDADKAKEEGDVNA